MTTFTDSLIALDHLEPSRIPSFDAPPPTPPPTNTAVRPVPRKKIPKLLEDIEMQEAEHDEDDELLKAIPSASRRDRSAASSTSSKRDLSESPSQADMTPKRARKDSDADKKLKTDTGGLDLSDEVVLEGTDVADLVPGASAKVSNLQSHITTRSDSLSEMRVLLHEETGLQADLVHSVPRALDSLPKLHSRPEEVLIRRRLLERRSVAGTRDVRGG